VLCAIAATVGHIWYHHPGRSELRRPAFALAGLVLVQITLGAFVIWSQKNVAINTAHVVVGALTLATSLVVTLRSHQLRFRGAATAAAIVAKNALSSATTTTDKSKRATRGYHASEHVNNYYRTTKV
jgi:heme A synthase